MHAHARHVNTVHAHTITSRYAVHAAHANVMQIHVMHALGLLDPMLLIYKSS
jgi:hypothetical protein